MWTVYKHISPSAKVYIGITSRDPAVRFGNGKGYKSNVHFWNAIAKYGWDAFDHVIIAEGLTYERACEMEKNLIAEARSYDSRFGYNIALGGQGHTMTESSKAKLSCRLKEYYAAPEQKAKMSARSKAVWADDDYHRAHSGENHPMYGHHHTDASKAKMSEARKGKPSWHKGKKRSAESRQKMRKAQLGHVGTPWTEEHKALQSRRMAGANNPNYGKSNPAQISMLKQINEKPVRQLLPDGTVVAQYNSCVEASIATGVHQTNIARVCCGNRKTAGGFVWTHAF